MATIRDLVKKVIAAGFTGKNIPNAKRESGRSPRRASIGVPDFDQLGKRQQKIVRRIAMGDRYVVTPKGLRLMDVDGKHRRCRVRQKDFSVINALNKEIGFRGFDAMLAAVRSHYQ